MVFQRTAKRSDMVRAVLDVRARSITAALVSDTKEGTPHVIWADQRPIRFTESLDKDRLRRAMYQSLAELIKTARTEGLGHARAQDINPVVNRLSCVFSSPWSRSRVIKSELSDNDSFAVTRDHIRAAGSRAHRQFNEWVKEVDEESELTGLNQRIISMHGDGEPVQIPHEKAVKKLEVKAHIAKLPRSVEQSVKRVLQSEIHPEQTDFHAAHDVASGVLSKTFIHPQHFFIIIPEHTQTDVLLVKDGYLQEVESFPIGEDFLVRTVSDSIDRSLPDTESRLRLHIRGKHQPRQTRDIAIAVEQIRKRWSELCYGCMKQMSSRSGFPDYTYLFMPPSYHHPIFKDFFRQSIVRLDKMKTHIAGDALFRNDISGRKVEPTLALSILGTHIH